MSIKIPRDRPTPTYEIEVTPAMITAGVKEFVLYRRDDDAEVIVENVFRAMLALVEGQGCLYTPLENS